MKKRSGRRGDLGFTLMELILVMTILAVLFVSALPNFTSVTAQSEISSRDAVLGAVQAGIQVYRGNDLIINGAPGLYPTQLDNVAPNIPCAPSSPCFGLILQMPVGDYKSGRGWSKVNTTNYTFNDGSNSYSYLYDTSNGSFILQ